jgi:DNA-binding CsgD family transcriptional regulator
MGHGLSEWIDAAVSGQVTSALPPVDAPAEARDPLADRANHLLALAAVWESPFSPEDAAELLGEPVGSVRPLLEGLLDIGVLCWTGDMLVFSDGRAREVRYLGLTEPLRMALHRQIGSCLASRDMPTERAVTHLSRGSRPGHRADLVELDAAIRRVSDQSPMSAADVAVRAYELSAPEDEQWAARSVRATRALLDAGRAPEATALAEHSVGVLGSGAAVARLRIMLSAMFLMSCRWEEASNQAAVVLEEPGLPARIYAEAKLAKLRSLVSEGNQAGMRSLVASIMGGSETFDHDAALGGAFVVNAQWAWDGGRPSDAVAFLRAAVERGGSPEGEVHIGHPRLLLAAVLASIGEDNEAKLLIEDSAERIRRTGDTLWAPAIAVQSAQLSLNNGRLSDALQLAETGLRQADAQGTTFFSALAGSIVASVALLCGDLVKASAAIERAVTRPPPDIGFYGGSAIARTRARVTEAQGMPERALATLSATCRDPVRLHRMLLDDPAAAPWWVRVALNNDERRLAAEVVWTMERLVRAGDPLPCLTASASHARGLYDRDLLALQAAAFGHIRPWARASAAEDASRLAWTVDRSLAMPCLEEALAGYERAGAVRDADRVGRALRRFDQRVRHGRQGDRPVSGWGSLTDAERRVALTVAEGRTNLEAAATLHLSRHTVDFHLRHIFRKLNLVSRVELAWSVANRQQTIDVGV